MPFGFLVFRSSSSKARLPGNPSHSSGKQQAKNANPPAQHYRDNTPKSTIQDATKGREGENVEDLNKIDNAGGKSRKQRQKQNKDKENWQLLAESRAMSR